MAALANVNNPVELARRILEGTQRSRLELLQVFYTKCHPHLNSFFNESRDELLASSQFTRGKASSYEQLAFRGETIAPLQGETSRSEPSSTEIEKQHKHVKYKRSAMTHKISSVLGKRKCDLPASQRNSKISCIDCNLSIRSEGPGVILNVDSMTEASERHRTNTAISSIDKTMASGTPGCSRSNYAELESMFGELLESDSRGMKKKYNSPASRTGVVKTAVETTVENGGVIFSESSSRCSAFLDDFLTESDVRSTRSAPRRRNTSSRPSHDILDVLGLD